MFPRTALTPNASLGEVRHLPLSLRGWPFSGWIWASSVWMLRPGADELDKWAAGGLVAECLQELFPISK
jgi:hypothetical protein